MTVPNLKPNDVGFFEGSFLKDSQVDRSLQSRRPNTIIFISSEHLDEF